MAGWFYPPPPPFVGGRQPNAPKDGIPVSGLPPPPPMVNGSHFTAILNNWLPGPPPVQAQRSPVSYILPAPSQPPVTTRNLNAQIIRSTWDVPVWWPLPAAMPLASGAFPPVPNASVLSTIRASWELPVWWPLPSVKVFTPSGITPQPAPLVTQFQTIVQAWTAAAPLPQTLAQLPQSSPSNVPVSTFTTQQIVLNSWVDNVWTVIYLAQVTQSGPPPGFNSYFNANQRTLLQSWDNVQPLPQQTRPIAGILPAPSQPPPVQSANLRTLLQGWDVIPPLPQVSMPIAGILPGPSQPPPKTLHQFYALIESWKPPVWWPLPALNVRAQSGIIPQPTAPMQPALFAQVMDSWKPPVWWPLPALIIQPVSGLPTTQVMPNVVGLTQAAAIALLNSDGFFTISTSTGYSPIYPPGIVMAQAPAPGIVPFGSPVSLQLSLGVQPANTVIMPNVVGQILQMAIKTLEQAGVLVPSKIGYFGTYPISVNWVSAPHDPDGEDTVHHGVVTAQSLAAGLAVKVNQPIILTVLEYPKNVAFP